MNEFEKIPYYISSRLNRYIKYKLNNIKDKRSIVEEVNCNLDYEYYNYNIKADKSLNNYILVNKYYYLDKDYIPSNLSYIDKKYSLRGCLKKEAKEAFEKMCNDALNQNLNLINASAYRSYKRQEEIYHDNYLVKGNEADKTSARPGFSEHQTGYAVDIRTKECDIDQFYGTKEYYWLIKNSYKYGFILRYPIGKEKITGYSFEPWHYRYVGNKIASYIFKNNITFDEYYAYFIENKKEI